MELIFTVNGAPKGKGRPRFANTRYGVKTYTPQQTAMYENLVALSYQQQHPDKKMEGPISAHIVAFFPIPKSASKKARAEMERGERYFDHKPDADNIAKVILDSLNGIAFDDDRQVVSLSVTKYYSDRPRCTVRLAEIGKGKAENG